MFPANWDFSGDDENAPQFEGRFSLSDDGSWFADVFSQGSDENVELGLHDIAQGLGIEINQDMLLDLIATEGTEDFDSGDPDARGPYDKDEVINFMNETGWWGIADIYYDADFDEYYVNINYE